jgi:hypothetical protein
MWSGTPVAQFAEKLIFVRKRPPTVLHLQLSGAIMSVLLGATFAKWDKIES